MYIRQHFQYILLCTIGSISSTIYHVQQAEFSLHCIMYNRQHLQYTVLCTIGSICSTMYYVQQVSFAIQCIMYNRYHLQYNVLCTIGIICNTMYYVQKVSFEVIQCNMYIVQIKAGDRILHFNNRNNFKNTENLRIGIHQLQLYFLLMLFWRTLLYLPFYI